MENTDIFDVLIIGGGPGGLSAAIWCADVGLTAVLAEREAEFGGQMLRIFNPIENYPGLVTANGREMLDRFAAQAVNSSTVMHLRSEAVGIDVSKKTVRFAEGTSLTGRNIIIATGVRRRRLGVPGEFEFSGRGMMESGSRSPEAVAGQNVAIIGGGDAAMENAMILGENAKRVYVIHRRDELSARTAFVQAARATKNIEFLMHHSVKAIVGNRTVEAVEAEDLKTHERKVVAVNSVLVRIGVEPNSDIVRGSLATDEQGYIHIDSCCKTSVPDVYAIGDVANRTGPTISSAAGQAATAAKAIAAKIYA
jgi:thioredoxin reductase (NADPH)